MEIKHGKHVTLTCALKVGDKGYLNGFGYKFKDNQVTITKIERETNCASGFMITVDGYDYPVDSDWFSFLKD